MIPSRHISNNIKTHSRQLPEIFYIYNLLTHLKCNFWNNSYSTTQIPSTHIADTLKSPSRYLQTTFIPPNITVYKFWVTRRVVICGANVLVVVEPMHWVVYRYIIMPLHGPTCKIDLKEFKSCWIPSWTWVWQKHWVTTSLLELLIAA